MDKMSGSMDVLSVMQLTSDTTGLDTECKALLHSKEVLAVILQGTVEEYAGYSLDEIKGFIEPDSIEEEKEVSAGRTNSLIRGDSVEYAKLNEKTSFFDVLFRAKNPVLSKENMLINLHIDLEPQKNYRPGYPIERRGIYYLARSLSAQLSLVTEETNYGELEKCYSIWICRDNVPKEEQYSISFYELTNAKNIGNCTIKKENFDLLKLVVIRLGNRMYNSDYQGEAEQEGHRVLRFLNAIMYPHDEGFMDTISEYIDFSQNEELWKERENMFSLGQCILEEGMETGVRALIIDNLEENVPEDKIIRKLQRHFGLSEEKAKRYYKKYTEEE